MQNDINTKDKNGMTALMHAVRSQHKEADVVALLNAGADVNAQDDNGMSALMFAVIANKKCFSLAIIHNLIAGGADVNAKNHIDETSLWQAISKQKASSNRIEAVDALIEAGAEVNEACASDYDLTPLILTAVMGNDDVCERIISAGADVNAQDGNGDTALIYARCFKNPVAMSKILIAAGADIRTTNNYGATALSAAKHGNNDMLLAFLESKTHEHIVNRKSVIASQPKSYEYSF
jgi:ankyrin repeat protein